MSRSEALCAGLRLRPKMAIRRCVAMRGAMSRYVAMSRAVCPLRVYILPAHVVFDLARMRAVLTVHLPRTLLHGAALIVASTRCEVEGAAAMDGLDVKQQHPRRQRRAHALAAPRHRRHRDGDGCVRDDGWRAAVVAHEQPCRHRRAEDVRWLQIHLDAALRKDAEELGRAQTRRPAYLSSWTRRDNPKEATRAAVGVSTLRSYLATDGVSLTLHCTRHGYNLFSVNLKSRTKRK